MDVISVVVCIRIGIMKIVQHLKSISQSHWYWLAYIAIGIVFLAVALFYQHVLEQLPCVICIQTRLLVVALILIAVTGLLSRNNRTINVISHLSAVVINAVFVERAYILLGTERGFVFSDCGFDLGLPSWLAVEEWMPWLFRVETTCGYTPELIFGITMAEVLMVLSSLFLLVSFCVALMVLVNIIRRDNTL